MTYAWESFWFSSGGGDQCYKHDCNTGRSVNPWWVTAPKGGWGPRQLVCAPGALAGKLPNSPLSTSKSGSVGAETRIPSYSSLSLRRNHHHKDKVKLLALTKYHDQIQARKHPRDDIDLLLCIPLLTLGRRPRRIPWLAPRWGWASPTGPHLHEGACGRPALSRCFMLTPLAEYLWLRKDCLLF